MDRIERLADLMLFRISLIERLTGLETRVELMAQQPAARETQPAPAKRETLRLKVKADG